MIRALVLSAALLVTPGFAVADAAFTRLYDLLEMDAYVAITRDEGLEAFTPMAQDMLGHPPDEVLIRQADAIYDLERMRYAVKTQMQNMLTRETLAGAELFFGSDVGQRIVELELAARRAMSDPTIEQAARAAWARAAEDKPWMVARINELIEVSDLIERNVSGALNSNLRFYEGMADAGALNLATDEILGEVWAQEAEIREDTTEWLGAYLLLAYQPLSEDDIETYLTFWQTPPGVALNAALFDGYNHLYDQISYATARIVSLRLGTQEL